MKIIGGFDHYDGAGMGVDTDIVLLRSERTIWHPPFSLPEPLVARHASPESVSFFLVLIGGEVIPGAIEAVFSKQTGLQKHIHYTEKDAKAAFERLAEQPEANKYTVAYQRRREALPRHFGRTRTDKQLDWMISNSVTQGIIDTHYENKDLKGVRARVNGTRLREYEAYRVMDSATTHMTISNFVGGVLPRSVQTVDIGNTDKIRKAGFDTKTSFRKGPTKKRRG